MFIEAGPMKQLAPLVLALLVVATSTASPQSDAGKQAVSKAETTTTPIIPQLNEVDALKLQSVDLQAQNIRLQIAALQGQLATLEAQARPYLQTLVRPGYTLARGQDGQWRYVAETKAPEAPKPEPKK
jgi:TolA-binding protein